MSTKPQLILRNQFYGVVDAETYAVQYSRHIHVLRFRATLLDHPGLKDAYLVGLDLYDLSTNDVGLTVLAPSMTTGYFLQYHACSMRVNNAILQVSHFLPHLQRAIEHPRYRHPLR